MHPSEKSLTELLAYAEKTGVRLGIENRYHYMEFPSPDELEEPAFSGRAGPDRLHLTMSVMHKLWIVSDFIRMRSG